MARGDRLERYRAKRDFSRTAEPRGRHRTRRGEPRFVVQEHDATTLHYDLRLEVGGVLRSWSVPKGPSTDPRDRRMAIPTEDHPLEYQDFEGVIPEGSHGAGPVIVWDTGTYRNLTRHNGEEIGIDEALDDGHAVFWLDGQKLRGGYVLTRIRKRQGKGETWLLIKMTDDGADRRRNPVRTQRESVLSGRTIDEVAGEVRA